MESICPLPARGSGASKGRFSSTEAALSGFIFPHANRGKCFSEEFSLHRTLSRRGNSRLIAFSTFTGYYQDKTSAERAGACALPRSAQALYAFSCVDVAAAAAGAGFFGSIRIASAIVCAADGPVRRTHCGRHASSPAKTPRHRCSPDIRAGPSLQPGCDRPRSAEPPQGST